MGVGVGVGDRHPTGGGWAHRARAAGRGGAGVAGAAPSAREVHKDVGSRVLLHRFLDGSILHGIGAVQGVGQGRRPPATIPFRCTGARPSRAAPLEPPAPARPRSPAALQFPLGQRRASESPHGCRAARCRPQRAFGGLARAGASGLGAAVYVSGMRGWLHKVLLYHLQQSLTAEEVKVKR